MDLLFERDRELYFDYFKLTSKDFMRTRIKSILFFSVLYGIILYFYLSYLLVALIPLVLLFGYKLPYYNLIQLKKKDDLIRQHIFPKFLISFISLINTEGNVYKTLVASLDYVQDPFRSKLKELVEKLDKANSSEVKRKAYLDFAGYIDSPEAFNVMYTINSFDESGIKQSDLDDFENLIMNIQREKRAEQIETRTSLFMHLLSNPIIMAVVFYILTFVYVIWKTTIGSFQF